MDKEYKWKKYIAECHYESPADFLWFYIMNGCGCGSFNDFKAEAWKLFEDFALNREAKWDLYDNPVRELLAHWLDSKGLVEHGTSIRGSWLNEQGKTLYDDLLKHPISK